MSDQKPALSILDFLGISDRQVIQSVLADALIADYGIVKAVRDNAVVDVEHASLRVLMGGIQAKPVTLDPRITYDVELLFPSSSGMAISWTIQPGDGVLLVGLQNVVPTVSGITAAQEPPEFWHYSSQTLKAIPLSAIRTDAQVQFGELDGKAFLRNQSQSLYTLLDALEAALETFMSTASQNSLTAAGATAPSLAAAMVALMASFQTATAQMRTNLGQLLEE